MKLYYRLKRIIEDAWHGLLARSQRFRQGYSYGDVWDMDLWFMRTIKPMLIHLRTNGISYPMEFNSRDQWCTVLDEMINCLEFMDEDNVRSFLGFGEVGYWERMTLEDNKRVYEIMANNKNRFFELFSKHFYDLWD